MSTTLKALLEAFAQEYHQGVLGTTTAAGSTTTLVDATRHKRPVAGNMFARNVPVRITSRAAVGGGAITVGQETYLDAYDPSTGTFTVSPAMDDTPEIGTTFIVAYSDGADTTVRWVEALNRFLTREAQRKMRVPLTFVPNGDYLASSAATGWTSTNATGAYVSLAHPDGHYHRVLQNTASAGSGRLTSTTLKATPNDTWNLYTFNRVTTAGDIAALVVYDETNGAAITPSFTKGSATYSGLSFQDILCTFTIPATCYQISIRLQSTASGDVSQWGPIVAAPQGTQTYTGQTALELLQDVGELWTFGCGTNGPQERAWHNPRNVRIDEQFGWGQGFTFQTTPPFPLYADMILRYAEIATGDPTSAASGSAASESDTTDCPKALALAGMAVEFFRHMHRQERLSRGPDSAQTRWGGMLADAEQALVAAQSEYNTPKTVSVVRRFSGVASA